MLSIYRKELAGYFSLFVGYLVIGLFLLFSGLVFWVFPQTSILEHGYATLESFFALVPYLFFFLIPAVSMRSLAGERADGTLDWMRTKPVTDLSVLMGKFWSGLTIIVLALLPTLLYVYTLYVLASPSGNIDLGGIFASYIGLILLAAAFFSIGLIASVLAPNPVAAFLGAVFACYLAYDAAGPLSMKVHFDAMGRGVLDSRDLVYMLSVTIIFLLLAHAILLRGRVGQRRIRSVAFSKLSVILFLIALNYAGTVFHRRVDFTREQRYGLSSLTKSTLAQIDGLLYIQILLDGNLPPGFQQLRKAAADFLSDLRAESPRGTIHIEFENPFSGTEEERETKRAALEDKAIFPIQLSVHNTDGSHSSQLIYPVALVSDGTQQIAVPLLQGWTGEAPDQTLHQSIENLEYAFVSAIRKLSRGRRPVIGFTEGNGELNDTELHDVLHRLADAFQVGRINLNKINFDGLDQLDVLVIAKPTHAFSESDKFKIDYFLMNGGSVVWAIDQLDGSLDSLRNAAARGQRVRTRQLGLDDQLFTYGVRLNHDLLIDLNCHFIPMTVRSPAGESRTPGMEWMPWPLHPVFIPVSEHPVVRNLDGILGAYSGTLDTLALEGIRKEILIHSSPFIQTVHPPVDIALSLVEDLPPPESLRTEPRPVVALLEGRFPSVFWNRPIPADLNYPRDAAVPERGVPARMVVLADGDIIANQVNPSDGSPYPLGWDRYTAMQFANGTFLLNMMDYLTDDVALIGLRSKEVPLRLLDRLRVQEEKRYWQAINVVAPLVFLLIGGSLQFFQRRRRYSQTGT